jgi:hypothetical protein
MNNLVGFTTENFGDVAINPMYGCGCQPTGVACGSCVRYTLMILTGRHEGLGFGRLDAWMRQHLIRQREAAIRVVTMRFLRRDADARRHLMRFIG